jgi:hypothetical protein
MNRMVAFWIWRFKKDVCEILGYDISFDEDSGFLG